MRSVLSFLIVIVLCNTPNSSSGAAKRLDGTIKIDGSSTVFPITEAVTEEFGKIHPRVRITIGISGTGGGFKKFTHGEIDINNASRPIKPSEEKKAKENGVEFIELPIAYDGISVVVNKNNTWVDSLTVAELKKIWQPGSKIKTWKDVRSSWPDEEIKLYGPGTDSGTFDYFTEAVNGKSQASRSDFTKSEDDNMLVQGVMGDTNALGYFGYAYYEQNGKNIKVVPIKPDKGAAVAPTFETIKNGTYAPLSRALHIYVSKKAISRPEVVKYLNFYLNNAAVLAKEVGYISMPKKRYKTVMKKLEQFTAAEK